MYNYHEKRVSRLEKSSSVGMMSQISIDNDIDIVDMDTTADLHRRLNELEKITLTFLSQRPLLLSTANDSFADIDGGTSQDFEIYIPEFNKKDVLCLDVVCIADSVSEHVEPPTQIEEPKTQHQNLDVVLKSAPIGSDADALIRHINTSNSFLPSYYNGEYEFSLTSSHGMTPGRYILSVTNMGNISQSVRTHLAIFPYEAATPVQAGERIVRMGIRAEYTYFRYFRKDSSQVVSVRVAPVHAGAPAGGVSDPDLYISNKYCGLVRVDGDNYLWRGTKVGADQVDIHPTEDPHSGRGDTFMVGVRCQKEQVGNFELLVNCSPPAPHQLLCPEEGSWDIELRADTYSYFRIPVDASSMGKLVLTITPFDSLHPSSSPEVNLEEVEQQFGRGIYSTDTLVSSGLFSREYALGSDRRAPTLTDTILSQISREEKGQQSSSQNILLSSSLSVPPSVAKTQGLFPVAFFSASCMYPSVETAAWRASSLTGNLVVVLESDEWRYSDKGVCYMSLIGVGLPGSADNTHAVTSVLKCRVALEERLDTDSLSSELRSRYNLYQDIFRGIDGSNISQINRSALGSGQDQHALTYGEVELPECIRILHEAGARDNQIFVDLGCGVGKTLVAAAFSGIKFVRCVGVEILPNLCEAARGVVLKTKNMISEVASSSRHMGLVDTSISSLAHNFPLLEIWEGDASDDSSLGVTSWTDADIVYVASLCFPDELMQKVCNIGCGLKEGSVLITLKLPEHYSTWFEETHRKWFKMSWGRVLVYFLRRNGIAVDSSKNRK